MKQSAVLTFCISFNSFLEKGVLMLVGILSGYLFATFLVWRKGKDFSCSKLKAFGWSVLLCFLFAILMSLILTLVGTAVGAPAGQQKVISAAANYGVGAAFGCFFSLLSYSKDKAISSGKVFWAFAAILALEVIGYLVAIS